ncbi:hypothetical protein [Nocardioides lijunqiniae]|uniref:hypothetical protein n=1 Tax=Nocardioides lijunqiniae TaxID=2760832 RepID=UPI0018784BD5|nr:hypothetical protein [Nocardioides lijunqiniae]
MLTARVVPRQGLALRALLATVEIMLGTVAAHTAAGGALPSPVWIATASALVLGGGIVVLRGRAPLWLVVPALAAAQLLLHCWLALTPGHDMAAHGAAHPAVHSAGSGAAHLELTGPMLLAHLGAALLTAAVWRVRRRAVRVLLAWTEPVRVPIPARVITGTPSRAGAVLLRTVLSVAPRRGPPAISLPA